MSLQVTVVSWGEERDITCVFDTEGRLNQELVPVEGSERAYLDLAFPDGVVVRVAIPHGVFTQQVLPQLQWEAMLASEKEAENRTQDALKEEASAWEFSED